MMMPKRNEKGTIKRINKFIQKIISIIIFTILQKKKFKNNIKIFK